MEEMAKLCALDGVKMDFSINSITPVMRWVLKKLTKIRKQPDPKVPAWIRNTEVYTKNMFAFDQQSGKLILRTAYISWGIFCKELRNVAMEYRCFRNSESKYASSRRFPA